MLYKKLKADDKAALEAGNMAFIMAKGMEAAAVPIFHIVTRTMNNRRAEPCGIEDLTLQSSRMRGNKSPAPPD
jgi:hypothetical protein